MKGQEETIYYFGARVRGQASVFKYLWTATVADRLALVTISPKGHCFVRPWGLRYSTWPTEWCQPKYDLGRKLERDKPINSVNQKAREPH